MKQHSILFNKELMERSRYSKFQDFHSLMRKRVRNILLVSSLYDSYIFEEDNRLYEFIRREYQGLNLSHSPELIQVSSGKEAIRLANEEKRFDLIITTLHIDDMSAIALAKKVKDAGLKIPVILLNYENREMTDLINSKYVSVFDKVFIWQGDYRIILGIIKSFEDRYNVDNDTKRVGVQSIIVIEDNVRFYSSFLPLIYNLVLKQSQNLLTEGVNLSHRFLRMRARPKILLCSSYEEAWEYFEKYEENILGIISDIDFSHAGKPDPSAGINFAQKVLKRKTDIPILLQSSMLKNKEIALSLGVSFLYKEAPTLLEDLKSFINMNFGFGDFIFRDNAGNKVGCAKNLTELEEQLAKVPIESIVYHASRNHFSNWLKARTEFWLAHQLRPKKVEHFSTMEDLRKLLIDSVRQFRKSQQVGVISDFNKKTFDASSTFARIGGGSLGGKARGLGFVNRLLSDLNINNKFKDVNIVVPSGVVVATDVFDQFLNENNLHEFALRCRNDEELEKRFLAAEKFPEDAVKNLHHFLDLVDEPIAVRSSSLLEDSQGQPFAGVYDTVMLPNNNPYIEVRLDQLIEAVKRIYASIFYNKSKDYIRVTSYRLEEEKMAVVIQKIVGAEHNGKYYPDFSGVAKSYNFYPTPPMKSTDGIVSAAPGLGKYIVEGGIAFRFCPKYPRNILQCATIEDQLNYSPKEFFALDLNQKEDEYEIDPDSVIKKYNISVAEKDGTLKFTGSTYSIDNNIVYDTVERDGPKLFTLAPILKNKLVPLPEILDLLLKLGNWGTGIPVEIEFAVNMKVPKGEPIEFGLLQMRPLVISNEIEELEVDHYEDKNLLCKSDQVLGHGVIANIKDIVFVDIEKFDRRHTGEIASEIARFNAKMINDDVPYLLIGLGRWGTMDTWLGIPVNWEQINGAKAIIECNFKDFNVTPSQGSHFFQNITSFKIGYFTVDELSENGFIDWQWLNKQIVVEKKNFTKHVRLQNPITVKINGHKNKGIIIKPE